FSWVGEDKDGHQLMYYVYIDRIDGKTTLVSYQKETTYIMKGLIEGKYYWCVIPFDGFDNGECISGIWSFTVDFNATPNYAPLIVSIPSKKVAVGTEYIYDVDATDEDNDVINYYLKIAPEGMKIDQQTGVIRWIVPLGAVGLHEIVVSATDGKSNATQRFTLEVTTEGMNHLPEVTSIPILNATVGEQYIYRIIAKDEDEDVLTFSLEVMPEGMSISSTIGIISWTPKPNQIGSWTVVTVISDGKAYTTHMFTIVVSPKPNNKPRITSLPLTFTEVGDKYEYIISASDLDGDKLTYTLDLAPAGMSIDASGKIEWKTTGEDVGMHYVIVNVSDGKDFVLQEFEIEVKPIVKKKEFDILPYLIAIVCIVALSMSALGFYVLRKKKPIPEKVLPAEKVMPEERRFAMEDIFFIYSDGRLIHHITCKLRPDTDEQIISSMLTAVQQFIKDAIAKDVAVSSMEYGENKIMYEKGKYSFLVVVISGFEPSGLREEMKSTIKDIEAELGGIIGEWDGDIMKLSEAKKFLIRLSKFKPLIEKKEEIDVKVLSEVEFYQGFVRVKVAVKNNTPHVITDSALKIAYNDEALRLDHIEPTYPIVGKEIIIGNVGAREKKTVGLYLDPQICMESYMDGTFSFRDPEGNIRHADMKRKMVSVVCPIMYTEENVNTAMLKRMISEELSQKDVKIFRIPEGLELDKAFVIAKRAVQHHDVKFVRDFVQKEPYIAEAWFFGMTKARGDKLVIRTSIKGETETVEFFVASGSVLIVTGLLAELKTDLNKELRSELGLEEKVEQVIDTKTRDEARKAPVLLERYVEAEISAGEIEIIPEKKRVAEPVPEPIEEEKKVIEPVPEPIEEEKKVIEPVPEPIEEEKKVIEPVPKPIEEEKKVIEPVPEPVKEEKLQYECPECGAVVKEEDKKCPKCGVEFEE
ncbi:MAG: putative Ig domain-containing protein, partial [Candidatus Thermoplasmatota archaeon]